MSTDQALCPATSIISSNVNHHPMKWVPQVLSLCIRGSEASPSQKIARQWFEPRVHFPNQEITPPHPLGPEHDLHFCWNTWSPSASLYNDLWVASSLRAECDLSLKPSEPLALCPERTDKCCSNACLNRLKFHAPNRVSLAGDSGSPSSPVCSTRRALMIYNLFLVTAESTSFTISMLVLFSKDQGNCYPSIHKASIRFKMSSIKLYNNHENSDHWALTTCWELC